MDDNEYDDDESFIQAYLTRLGLNATDDLSHRRPTLQLLSLLTERHLEKIPFENLSMHTTTTSSSSPKVVLSRNELMDKLLWQGSGGCCLELNGLFGMLLQTLDFKIKLVPCWVAAGPERGNTGKKRKFRVQQSHFVLLVQNVVVVVDDDDNYDSTPSASQQQEGNNNNNNWKQQPMIRRRSSSYLVDVGLGEPPIYPLEYAPQMLGVAQTTPEGMTSRIVWDPKGTWVDGAGRSRTCLLLEWYNKRRRLPQQHDDEQHDADGFWEPRLQWDVVHAPLLLGHEDEGNADAVNKSSSSSSPPSETTITLESFRPVIDILTSPQSTFGRKLIVCKLTRHAKVSLSGRVLKRTTNRFGNDEQQQQQVETTTLPDESAVRHVLQTEFGIVLDSNVCLDLTTSDANAHTKLWEHL